MIVKSPTFPHALIHWYRQKNDPLPVPARGSRDPYRIWVAEIMLQQTQLQTVRPYYESWMARFPDTRSLAAADLESVLKHWEGLGYYGRARNLHKAAVMVMDELGGELPRRFADWLALPGVGEYTAAAVASIAFGEPVAAVDGNVLRVYARLTLLERSIDTSGLKAVVRSDLETVLETVDPGEFNQALMDLGREICTPKDPLCDACPLKTDCRAFRETRQQELPIRTARRSVAEYRIVVGLIRRNGKLYIQQRKPEGHLGGLWEFPGGKVETGENLTEALTREILEETGLRVTVQDEITTLKHAYTHFRIHLTAYHCRFEGGRVRLQGATRFEWIDPATLDRYPFPKANHKIFAALRSFDQLN